MFTSIGNEFLYGKERMWARKLIDGITVYFPSNGLPQYQVH